MAAEMGVGCSGEVRRWGCEGEEPSDEVAGVVCGVSRVAGWKQWDRARNLSMFRRPLLGRCRDI